MLSILCQSTFFRCREKVLITYRGGYAALRSLTPTYVEADFDECLAGQYSLCDDRAKCENLPGSFSCTCKDGMEDDILLLFCFYFAIKLPVTANTFCLFVTFPKSVFFLSNANLLNCIFILSCKITPLHLRAPKKSFAQLIRWCHFCGDYLLALRY